MFQGERIEKGQGTWDPSEEPPCDVTSLSWLLFSFLFVPETFYKRTEQKEKNIGSSTAIITTTRAVLMVQLLSHCMTAFFFFFFTCLFFPLTWWLQQHYELKELGQRVQNIGFMASFALFHGLLFIFISFFSYGEVLDSDERRRRTGGRSNVKISRDES